MSSTQQFLLFFVVGVITTGIDFAIFNFLTGRRLRWRRIHANLVSVSVAMTWSFLANWFLVFQPDGYAWLGRAGRFLATTAFSAFVLQNVILYFTSVWKWPGSATLLVVRKLSLFQRFGDDIIIRNVCKGMAVSAGLIWNFCWYRLFVYAN